MAINYVEFDTTPQNLLADLRTNILASSDWTRLTPSAQLTATTVATSVNGTVLTVPSTTGLGLSIGSMIAIDAPGASREYRVITAMAATTITVAAMTYAHASGTAIYPGDEVYKCTTTRGADMIVNLNDGTAITSAALSMAVYRTHDGTVGTDRQGRWLYWRSSGGALTNPIHVTLSLGKEHMFLAIEGPRAIEAGAVSTAYGSPKTYFFICDLVPYDPTDNTPTVVSGGTMAATIDASITWNSHQVQVARNLNGSSWGWGKLLTLDFPHAATSETVNVQRVSAIDGKYALAPYVLFSDADGQRGRLNGIFNAGYTWSNTPEIPNPPIGSKQQYQGQWYKLIAANKSDGADNRQFWGPLGAAYNSQGAYFWRSVVIAVPCLP